MGWPYQQKPLLGWPLDYDSGLVPVAGWLMNEGTGDRIFDLSGNGNIGTFAGNTSWEAGNLGPVTSHEGTNSQIIVPDNSILDVGLNDFTVVISAKFNILGANNQNLLRKWDGTDGYWLGWSGGLTSLYYILEFDGTIVTDFAITPNPVVGQYYQYALRAVRSGNVSLFIDGIERPDSIQDISGHAAKDMSNAADLLFGGYASWWLNGNIEYIYIYNRALSASEITLLYREPFCMYKDPAEAALPGGYQAVAAGAKRRLVGGGLAGGSLTRGVLVA